MNLTNIHIITINHTEEYFKQAIQTLKPLNLQSGSKITFGGERGALISKSEKDQLTQYSGWNLKNSGNAFATCWNSEQPSTITLMEIAA